jgi:hypothetical protein
MAIKGRKKQVGKLKSSVTVKNTHRKLCEIGAKWLKNVIQWQFRYQYILIEFCPMFGESPDVFGLRTGSSILIEVKTSRKDFLIDFKKPYRKEGKGIGLTRYYLCPTNLIKVSELPKKWGLLYCNKNDKITVIKKSENFIKRDYEHELVIMQSVIRRLAGRPRVLDFRKIK